MTSIIIWPEDLVHVSAYQIMNFLGQGVQKLQHHREKERDATEHDTPHSRVIKNIQRCHVQQSQFHHTLFDTIASCAYYITGKRLKHGRRSWGGRGGQVPPRIWSMGTLVQIVPLRFLSYRYKKERSVAFKVRQNPFSPRALPRTPLRELTTLPQTP